MQANPQELYTELTQNRSFQQWQKKHTSAYLTHFFSSLASTLNLKTNWEIGYYDATREKITIFASQDNGDFEIMPEDDIFKSEQAVEALSFSNVKFSFAQAATLFKQKVPLLFPKEEISDGFVILQKIKQKTIWNFAFMTKTIQYLNIKIDAETGEIVSSELITVAQRE